MVTAADHGKTYGDTDPTLTGTLSGFLAADGISATYARAAGENVGPYVITPTLVDPNGKADEAVPADAGRPRRSR